MAANYAIRQHVTMRHTGMSTLARFHDLYTLSTPGVAPRPFTIVAPVLGRKEFDFGYDH